MQESQLQHLRSHITTDELDIYKIDHFWQKVDNNYFYTELGDQTSRGGIDFALFVTGFESFVLLRNNVSIRYTK